MPIDLNQNGINRTYPLYHPNHQTGPLPEQQPRPQPEQQPRMQAGFNTGRLNPAQILSEFVAMHDTSQIPLSIIRGGYNTGLPPLPPSYPTRDQYPLLDYQPVNDNSIEEEKGP